MGQPQSVTEQSPGAARPRVGNGSPLISTIRRKLADGTLNMPVVPKVMQELQRIMRDPDQEMRRVVEVVKQDQELALRILAMSNSAAIVGRRPNRSLPDALVRVGLKAAYGLAVRFVTERFHSGIVDAGLRALAEQLWRRTLAVAMAARIIAR